MNSTRKIDDKPYWENFYKTNKAPVEPSSFAKFVLANFLKRGQIIIELGCCNGRDALFFAHNGVKTLAIDQCNSGFSGLKHDNLKLHVGDFTELEDMKNLSAVYSRFTLHAISREEEQKVFTWAANNIKAGGQFFIEVRTQKNELYQKGEAVEGEPDAFIYNNHYRRFLNFEQTVAKLKELGFTILFASEDKGFAPFGDTDYIFGRIIAQRK